MAITVFEAIDNALEFMRGTVPGCEGGDVYIDLMNVRDRISDDIAELISAQPIKGGDVVVFEGCRWRVLWCDGAEAGIQSLGGTEAIRVKVGALKVVAP